MVTIQRKKQELVEKAFGSTNSDRKTSRIDDIKALMELWMNWTAVLTWKHKRCLWTVLTVDCVHFWGGFSSHLKRIFAHIVNFLFRFWKVNIFLYSFIISALNSVLPSDTLGWRQGKTKKKHLLYQFNSCQLSWRLRCSVCLDFFHHFLIKSNTDLCCTFVVSYWTYRRPFLTKSWKNLSVNYCVHLIRAGTIGSISQFR